jgi:hypothetical protein
MAGKKHTEAKINMDVCAIFINIISYDLFPTFPI